MKKVLGLLAAAAVLSSGVSFAQTEGKHDVEVKIPNVLRIRFVDGNAPVSAPDAVLFDFVTDATRFETGTSFGASTPTDGGYNWDDVQVFSNDVNWFVGMTLSDKTGPEPVDGEGFDWDQVTIEGATGANINASFDLMDPFIAGNDGSESSAKTRGWESLGFGPDNFRVTFDGTEDAGDYSTTVTYNIFSN